MNFIKRCFCAGSYSKHSICINSFNLQQSYESGPMGVVLIWQMLTLNTEKLRNLPGVMQLGCGRAGICIQAAFSKSWLLMTCSRLTCCTKLPIELCCLKSQGLEVQGRGFEVRAQSHCLPASRAAPCEPSEARTLL